MSHVPPAGPIPPYPSHAPYPAPRQPAGPLGRTVGPFVDDGLRPLPAPEPPGPRHPDARVRRPWLGPGCTTLALLLLTFAVWVWIALAGLYFCEVCDPAGAAALERARNRAYVFLLCGVGVSAVPMCWLWLTRPVERYRDRRTWLGFAAVLILAVASGLASSVLPPDA